MVRQLFDRGLQVAPGHVQGIGEKRAGATTRLLVSVPLQRRRKPVLHLVAEHLLELGVAAEAELGDEPGHGGRADAGPLGEPGDALQAGNRIRSQEHPGQLPLGRAQAGQVVSDQLADPRLRRRVVCYIPAQSAPSRHILDKNPIAC